MRLEAQADGGLAPLCVSHVVFPHLVRTVAGAVSQETRQRHEADIHTHMTNFNKVTLTRPKPYLMAS